MESISFAQNLVAGSAWLIVDAQGKLKIAPQGYTPLEGDVIISVGDKPLTIPEDIVSELRVSIVQQNGIQSVNSGSLVQQVIDSNETSDDRANLQDDEIDDDGSSLTTTGAVIRDGAQTIASTDFQTEGIFSDQLTVEQNSAIEELVIQSVAILDSVQNTPPTIDVFLVNNFAEGDDVSEDDVVAQFSTRDADGDNVTVVLSDEQYYKIEGDGSVVLTELGADRVNSGYELPPFRLTPNDGQQDGESALIDPVVTPAEDMPNGIPEFISGEDLEGDAPNSDVYNFNAPEGSEQGSSVGIVSAFDADDDTLTYSFDDGTTTQGYFDINPDTGEITLNQDIDDAQLGDYSLTVKVIDGNGGQDSSTVNIALTNVNDAPEFISGEDLEGDAPNSDVYNFNAPEGSEQGDTVGIVSAFDADDDTLTYSFDDGTTTQGYFDINPDTGEITLNQDIDDAQLGDYSLTVKVIDGNGGVDSATVNIALTNVNDAPEFISGEDLEGDAPNSDVYNFNAPEGSEQGDTVGIVRAFDADDDTLTYSFDDGTTTQGYFDINPDTGEITLNQDIDDAQLGDYSLTVKVIDGNGGQDSATVNIALTNVNDAPEFISGEDLEGDAPNSDVYNFNAPEGSEQGDTVGIVSAFDADDDTLTYSFDDGTTTQGYFDINPDTGEITLNQDIDDAQLGDYSLAVKVIDGNGGVDSATVNIALTNVNDAPEFISGEDLEGDAPNNDVYNFNAPEGSVQGSSVGIVSAFDADDDTLTYSFDDGTTTQGYFDINPDTGEITLNQDIDDAQLGDYSLTVKVIDGNGGQDSATVNIALTNVNDAPEFISGEDLEGDAPNSDVYNFNAPEGSEQGDTVGIVSAFDADDDTLTYSFDDGTTTQGYFDINPDTGEITLNQDIDDAQLGDYSLTIKVIDGNGGQDSATVNIALTNVNDAPTAQSGAVSCTEDVGVIFNWSDFNGQDIDNALSDLSVVIKSLPLNGVLQLNVEGDWIDIGVGDQIMRAHIDNGDFRFMPAENESGDDDFSNNGVGDQKSDYAQFQFAISDGDKESTSKSMTIDIAAVADMPNLVVDNDDMGGEVDTFVDLWDLSASLNDIDGSEELSVLISGLPQGTVVKDAQGNSIVVGDDEVADISHFDWSSLQANVPEVGSYNVEVSATATESSNSDFASKIIVLPLEIVAAQEPEENDAAWGLTPKNGLSVVEGNLSGSIAIKLLEGGTVRLAADAQLIFTFALIGFSAGLEASEFSINLTTSNGYEASSQINAEGNIEVTIRNISGDELVVGRGNSDDGLLSLEVLAHLDNEQESDEEFTLLLVDASIGSPKPSQDEVDVTIIDAPQMLQFAVDEEASNEILAGLGEDILVGTAGQDNFVWSGDTLDDGVDFITDFTIDTDAIILADILEPTQSDNIDALLEKIEVNVVGEDITLDIGHNGGTQTIVIQDSREQFGDLIGDNGNFDASDILDLLVIKTE
ncbi:cadherin domain-containing protein [Vibrio rarus]|uniref:cadherin domain-containing protein n=1 Tax=Vibrio rarus TaxID=413403 RepID=UPI0021C461D1|nr:cadherin domain-containing protein [Vibrio rarus]